METKTCPHCAETIKADATVCRFCGRDTRPRERLHWYDFGVILAAILFPIFGIGWGAYLMLDERRRPRGCALFLIGAVVGIWAMYTIAATL